MDQRRPFLLLAWALLLGLFVWSIRPVLSPVVLFLALVYLLTPFFGSDLYRRLVVVLGALTGLWLIHVAGTILAPFILALILAYIADPVVDGLERRGVGRTWGALAVLLGVTVVVGMVAVLLVPLVIEQGSQFIRDIPHMIDDLQGWGERQLRALAASDLPLLREVPFERALEIESEDITAWISAHVEALNLSWGTAIGLGRGLQTALTILGYLVLTPVLTFYLLRDLHRLGPWVDRIVPPGQTDRARDFLNRYDRLLGEYLRGQVLVALFVGLATGTGFAIVGFPNAVFLGVVAGVFNIVPYLGLIVSLVPALLIALVTAPLWMSLVKVAGVFAVVQALDGYVLSPKIVGDRVGLHPVWVMLAILAFGSFFGFVGLLLAIPLAVLIKLLVIDTLDAYRRSVYYREADKVRDEDA